MSRILKFRAWDKHHNFMTPIDWVSGNGENSLRFEIMQFIGLNDINGKEIYEGDIVRWGMHNSGIELYHRYAVVQIDPDIQFQILYYIDSRNMDKVKGDDYIFHYGNFAYKQTEKYLEVIGNIYENPELIRG